MSDGIFHAAVAGAAAAAKQAKNPPKLTVKEYLTVRVNELCEMHGIKQQDGPQGPKDLEGTPYTIIVNQGIKKEGELIQCYWLTEGMTGMTDQYLSHLMNFIGSNKLVTWRDRPEVVSDFPLPGYSYIYSRLTAY